MHTCVLAYRSDPNKEVVALEQHKYNPQLANYDFELSSM